MSERSLWTTRDCRLCPVLWADPFGFIVIMRRAECLTNEQWRTFLDDYDNWIGEATERLVVPVERKQCSFGIINGQIVAVDYGK